MPPLAENQGAFASALLDPAKRPSGLCDTGGRDAPHGDGNGRFNIYRNNVAVAVIDALSDMFPAVERLVGAEFFRATARAYMQEVPPLAPVLFRYGSDFGEFLDRFPPASSVPYLGDVARLEFARVQAYHAADRTPIGIADLGAVSADAVEGVRLSAHPSVALIRSRFPVVSLWGGDTGGDTSRPVDLTRAEDALIVRPQLTVETRILPTGGFDFLDALLAGRTLGEAAGIAAAAAPDFELSEHLAGLFAAGVFIGIRGAGQAVQQGQ